MGKVVNGRLTVKQRERLVGYAVGFRGVESEELKILNDSIKKTQELIISILGNAKPEAIQIKDTNDIYKLSNALSGLARARVETEKVLLEMNGLVVLAGQRIQEEIKQGLAQHPDLYAQMLPIIEAAIEKSDERLIAQAEYDAQKFEPDENNEAE